MEIPFDITTLENQATASSFSRGEEYYRSRSVYNLTYGEGAFSAKVRGTHIYQVSIYGTRSDPQFHCTCPYDLGGICKHIVAVGLAILNDEAEAIAAYEDAVVIAEYDVKNFPETFRQTSKEIKVQFLQQILSQNTVLQGQFMKYVAPAPPPPVEQPKNSTAYQKTIERTKEEVSVLLESLTFDEQDLFTEEYYDSGYYDDSDDLQERAVTVVQEALEPYQQRIQYLFNQGELTQGMAVLLGVYEGKFGVIEPASDELDVFYDTYSEEIGKVQYDLFHKLFTSLTQVVISPTEVQASVDLLLERHQMYEKSIQESDSPNALYYLKDFEPFFFAVITDEQTARYVQQQLVERDLVDADTAYVMLRVAEQTRDEALWIDTAREFADFEVEIARQLLDKYRQAGQTEDFLQLARQTFQQFPNYIDEYLAAYLSADASPAFYKEVHLYLIQRTHRLDYYQAARPYLSRNERDTLIEAIGKTGADLFYIKLLEIEERYAEILQRVHQRTSSDYGFDKLIEPILHVYPDKCFSILRRKCLKAVELRGRTIYQMIARWLQLMFQIKGHKDATDSLVAQLYHHKPNLPALRDEMKRAGLV